MTGDKDQFVTLETKEGGSVTFGDNDNGHNIGIGKIQISPSTFIENVLYVKGLKHNLISVASGSTREHLQHKNRMGSRGLVKMPSFDRQGLHPVSRACSSPLVDL